MKNYKTQMVDVKFLESITCDVCKIVFENVLDTEEFISINHACGYGSIFGDGNKIEMDICQTCFKTHMGKFIK